MDFNDIKVVLQRNTEAMLALNDRLYAVNLDKDALWDLYLASFPAGTNELVKERTEHDCNHCKQFIRAIGNMVAIKADNTLVSIWDVAHDDAIYGPVFKALSKFVKSHAIGDVFISDEANAGVNYNISQNEDGSTTKWQHFFAVVPKAHQNKTSKSNDTVRANFRDNAVMLERSFETISMDSLATIIELIRTDSIYRGSEWLSVLEQFYSISAAYDRTITGTETENFCWRVSGEVGPVISKIKNHSIGTLLVDVSEGVPLDEAIRKYEAIVAPANYKRPTPVFTKKMLQDAKDLVDRLGLTPSLRRRFATIDDITVNNVLFADRSALKRMTGEDAFDELADSVPVNSKTFNRAAEISIEDFVKDVLPTATKVEMLVEPRHRGNLVSLIAPVHADSKTMFKWGNNFSWAYAGNLADSMKERVKAAGGNVNGVLRFSIQWNENGDNQNDFDAHCIEPTGNEIYFMNKNYVQKSSGKLDVDIIQPCDKIAVENIIYTNEKLMPEGIYRFFVHVYTYRNGDSGVRAEIEFNGKTFDFDLNPNIHDGMKIEVATIKYTHVNGFEVISSADNSMSTATIADVKANTMQPLTMCLLSPNYWNGNANGNKHYFFMVQDCHNAECPNGFFNEYLSSELLEHKRVFAALGDKMKVEPCANQLSGFGFSSTKRDHLFVKVYGHSTRMLKVVI